MQQTVAVTPAKIENAEIRLENLKADRETLRQLPIDEETKLPVFKITIDGTEYTDRKEAAQALEDAVLDFVKKSSDSEKEIGEFQGFKLSVKARTTSTAKVAAAIIKVGRLFNHTSVS